MKDFYKKICFYVVSRALRHQARRLLRMHRPIIVGITGSVGKTTTKLAVARVLEQKYKVQCHPGNYNTETGLPLAMFELESPGSVRKIGAWLKIYGQMSKRLRRPFNYDVMVLEMAVAKPNDMRYLTSFIKPDIGIETSVQPVHLLELKGLDGVCKEKIVLAEQSKTVLLNAEDKRLMAAKSSLGNKRIITFGALKGDYHFKDTKLDRAGHISGHLVGSGVSVTIRSNGIARHNLQALAVAAATGVLLDVKPRDIKKGLEKFAPFNGRMNLINGQNHSHIIDDSYNDSPYAATAAIDTLYGVPGKRKLAILGSMNELGSFSKHYHQMVGRHAASVDYLATVGAEAKQYLAPAANKAGLTPSRIKSFDSPYDAGEHIKAMLRPGDVVLVKGSQNKIFVEEATKQLIQNPKDRSKLVRQSDFWMKIKAEQFNR